MMMMIYICVLCVVVVVLNCLPFLEQSFYVGDKVFLIRRECRARAKKKSRTSRGRYANTRTLERKREKLLVVRNFNFCFSRSLLTREERKRRPFFPNKGAKVSHKKSHQLLFCRYTYDEQYHLVRSKEGTTTTTTREQLYRERAAFSLCRVHNRGRRKERPGFTNKTD